MALVTTKDMFDKAIANDYAVGAFNFINMETLQAIVEAAQEERSPVILQVSVGTMSYAKLLYLKKLVEAAIDGMDVPIALNLDHGTVESCTEAISNGFTSVMIDGSQYTFEENVKLTSRVVAYAHDRGVVVEAELGKIDNFGIRSGQSGLTDPEQAAEFVTRTGCDSLAVSIGTSHGAFKSKEPRLRFDILESISRLLPNYPLVLHGASSILTDYVRVIDDNGGSLPGACGIPEQLLKKAATMNVAKLNIDTDLRLAFTAAVRKHLAENPAHFDPRQYLDSARRAVKACTRRKMRDVLMSSNSAN